MNRKGQVLVTLENRFHQTQARVWVGESVLFGCETDREKQEAAYQHLETEPRMIWSRPADAARLARVRRALCGVKGCKCGVVR